MNQIDAIDTKRHANEIQNRLPLLIYLIEIELDLFIGTL